MKARYIKWSSVIFISVCFLFANKSNADAIRFLFPNSPYDLRLGEEISTLVNEYNQLHPESNVVLVRKGENFSALNELATSQMAGIAPDIALIGVTEAESIRNKNLIQPLPETLARKILKEISPQFTGSSPKTSTKTFFLPFQRSLPIIVVDQEILYRHDLKPEKLPQTWNELTRLAIDLSKRKSEPTHQYMMAIPWMGAHGPRMLESLLGMDIVERTASGLRTNHRAHPRVKVLYEWMNQADLSRKGLTWEQAIDDFTRRKVPILITATETLPYLESKVYFKWAAAALPTLSGSLPRMAGSQLAVTNTRKEVLNFIEYLYSPSIAARWTSAGSFLPLQPSWTQTENWKKLKAAKSRSVGFLEKAAGSGLLQADRDHALVNQEWIKLISKLFRQEDSNSKTHSRSSLNLDDELYQMDARLHDISNQIPMGR